ncbi:MAG: molecular chaperone DnaJ [Candidatus Gastranaerophilales bacterium]|nr:molecular chaperone DnaJ [Candidatus Gastranaerophilales bacterium]
MTQRDYYEVLGVAKSSTSDEIKKAFRTKARELHPDVNKAPDAEEKFKELGQAYEVLMDDNKRSMYDRYGQDGLKNAGYDQSGPFEFGFGDLSEILSSFFGSGFGGSGSRRNANSPVRGSDLRLDIEISFEEAIFGVEKDVEIEHLETCESCSGSGMEPGTTPMTCNTCGGHGQIQQTTQTILGNFSQVSTCPTCGGSGKIISTPCKNCSGQGRKETSKIINIKIPKGVENGNKLRINSEGDSGKRGGHPGDLYVVLFVKPHELFKREGVNIYLEQPITFAQAALGDEIEVDTVDGKKILKIHPGIQSNTILTIKHAGVPYINNSSKRGDQFVKINLVTPTNLSEEEKKLFQRLFEIQNGKTRKDSFVDKVKASFTGTGS